MPRPYVQFSMEAVEVRKTDGSVASEDVVYVRVTAQGSKDVLFKPATDWFETLDNNAKNDRCPASWPRLYREAYEAFKKGEELPVDGYPIKNWPACTAAQRKNILALGVLTVEDLARANTQVREQLGLAGHALIESAKAWVAENNGAGALAGRVRELEAANQTLLESLENLKKSNQELVAKVAALSPTSSTPSMKVT